MNFFDWIFGKHLERQQSSESQKPVHKARAVNVAKRIGTNVDRDCPVSFWHTPLLEKLVERIEALEKDKQQDKR